MNSTLITCALVLFALTTIPGTTFAQTRDNSDNDYVSAADSGIQLALYSNHRQYRTSHGRYYPRPSDYQKRHKYNGADVYRGGAVSSSHSRSDARQHARAPLPPVNKPPEKIQTDGKPTFVFNPNEYSWGAYDADGFLLNYGRASGGQHYCPDIGRGCKTPSGEFSVYRKGTASCKSSIYPKPHGGAPMGWCMFFKGGYAIHASNDVPHRNASHGCVRVKPSAARWLSEQFIKIGTRVIVKGY